MRTLLAIDDDPAVLASFRWSPPGMDFDLRTASSATEGLKSFTEHRPDVVVLDINLPDRTGLETFRRLHEIDPKVPVIFMTGEGTTETAIEAMRLGAYEYLLKPPDPDQFWDVIARAFEISRLMRVPAVVATKEPAAESSDLLVGRCPPMQAVYKAIGRVASQDVTVLILGESGTGKELAARAIYHYSRRSAGPFLAINCAAIPETLLESELFGHEKGSFTGADRKRIGKFEQCSGGTLFLDEIGDMSPLTQTKILRVLQEQRFERVGGNETIQTDVRLIAATNRNLDQAVAKSGFRQDLLYRLNGFTIRLPALRDRREDLPALIEYFIKHFNPGLGKQVRRISPETLRLLEEHSWPGNVRELQSTIKYALVHAVGDILTPSCLPENLRNGTAPASQF